ncbi:hypothetical protein Phum_PHUM602810 [Pediculus humanus corporis]|uniref:Uncharacterized protein n=1 Tax=Pediculus humanus subsp. corporis TaxID=121224 RepID=E0W3B5_PEDHC|nr:uncharacterized protein Phum_PHUM602810 [Pediculus humanus corporis]EEB20121.1 hypothetical protein Phum_PHUM602810 [Pediculus humanus corporis]
MKIFKIKKKNLLSWRTLWFLCGLFVSATTGQQSSNENNYNSKNRFYSPWNVPNPPSSPHHDGYHGSNVDNSLGGTREQQQQQQHLADHGNSIDHRIFSTANKYDVVTIEPEIPGGRNDKNTPLYGGTIDGPIRLEKSKSPYVVREDVIIDKNGEMIIEPGVTVKFSPMAVSFLIVIRDNDSLGCLYLHES